MTAKHAGRLLAVLLTFLVACTGGSDSIQIVSTNFGETVETHQNLVFTFNHDLVGGDSLDRWFEIPFLEFEPKLRGSFKWTEPNVLVFSPHAGFQPSTHYKAVMTGALQNLAPQLRLPDEDERVVEFRTPYLMLLGSHAQWVKGSTGEPVLELRLEFNQNVELDALTSRLAVNLLGKNVDFVRGEAGWTSNSHRVTLFGLDPAEVENQTLELVIAAGLTPFGANWSTEEDFTADVPIPGRDRFDIVSVESLNDEGRTIARVYTTQAVSDPDLSRRISVEPKVAFKVEVRDWGMDISGEFKFGTTYTFTFNKAMRGIFGGTLGTDAVQKLTWGEIEPGIRFASSKGMYLTKAGARNIGMYVFNVPKLKVTVSKIYENNLYEYMRYGTSGQRVYDEMNQQNYWVDGYFNNPRFGNDIHEEEIETNTLARNGNLTLLNLDFRDNVPFEGMYVLQVASADQKWVLDTKLLAFSDLGLISKSSGDNVHVFVNSIKTAEPVAGVKVSFISTNNQQLHHAETDARGMAVFRNVRSAAPGFDVGMISARKADDYNFMMYDNTFVQTSRFDVGGLRNNKAGYQAFIYGERNLYRPGETLHFNTIVRDADWLPIAGMPIKFKLLLPNGNEFRSLKLELDKQGAVATDITLPGSAVTGSYIAEVYTANDILLNSLPISIEEFIPDRIRVDVKLNESSVLIPASIVATGQANNLFGPPAPNRNYEAEFSLKRKYFQSEQFPGFDFAVNLDDNTRFNTIRRAGKTAADGSFSESIELDANGYKDMGLLQGSVYSTVFDETGRPVHRLNVIDVFTQPVLYGVKGGDYWISAGETSDFQVAAADTSGAPATGEEINIAVYKISWETVVERRGSRYNYVSQRRERIVHTRKLVQSARDPMLFRYKPGESGRYEIRVFGENPQRYVVHGFYAYRWGGANNASFEVNNEGRVDITLDKPRYTVGDKARVLFTAPFDGNLLVSIERDEVIEHHNVKIVDKAAELVLEVAEKFAPNVYVAATLIKPHAPGGIPLTVAHGYQPLIAERKGKHIPVKIEAPEKIRSSLTQKITVKTRPEKDINLTIAVVDEGILQLKNYKTPDPFNFFYAKRALEVRSYDVYPYLFPELGIGLNDVGGDGYDLANRVNPLTNKRVRLVSYWSGIVKADARGEYEYEVEIPRFSGELRIMVAAYKDDAFGSAEHSMRVADPIVVSAGLPRFLSPGDTVLIPVTMTNTTEKSAQATARIKVDGPVSIIGNSESHRTIAPNQEERVVFTAAAHDAVGQAQFNFSVNALGENFDDQIDMTVRPASSLLKVAGSGKVGAGESATFNLDDVDLDVRLDAQLVVARTPLAEFSQHLKYLVGYPHGCVEQTVSRAFPQLYFNELAAAVDPNLTAQSNPHYNVREAIRKLESMQLYSGGFSYWPGGGEANWWGSVYATHFLLEARKADFEVSRTVIDRAMNYLRARARERKTATYYYYIEEDNWHTRRSRQIPSRDIFYSLYVLALNGTPDVPTMNQYKDRAGDITVDSRYMLAAAYALSGDRDSFLKLKPSEFGSERSATSFGGSFYSQVRDEALSLNMLLEVDPDDPQIAGIARNLSKYLKTRRYLNTQERSFAILALGKLTKADMEKGAPKLSVSIDGKEQKTDGGFPQKFGRQILNKSVAVRNTGQGNLYYFWLAEGYNAEARFPEVDNHLKVRKTYFTRSGVPMNGGSLKVNDLVVVRLRLEGARAVRVDNVVVTDLLPAGLEIENPRLASLPGMTWIDDAATPEHFDYRDDRINLFTSINYSSKQDFYYLARAVTPGNFVMGPVGADAMYDGEYHSYSGAGRLRIDP